MQLTEFGESGLEHFNKQQDKDTTFSSMRPNISKTSVHFPALAVCIRLRFTFPGEKHSTCSFSGQSAAGWLTVSTQTIVPKQQWEESEREGVKPLRVLIMTSQRRQSSDQEFYLDSWCAARFTQLCDIHSHVPALHHFQTYESSFQDSGHVVSTQYRSLYWSKLSHPGFVFF